MSHVLERDVDAVRILTVNNPETLNALTMEGARELGERLEAAGGMYLLPRLVGVTKATEMILTGEIIDAAEAYRVGLVNRVVAADRLMDAALELAGSLARGPARALAAAKAAINRGLASDLWTELDATVTAQLQCFATRDFAEGVRALAERRPPRFTGT